MRTRTARRPGRRTSKEPEPNRITPARLLVCDSLESRCAASARGNYDMREIVNALLYQSRTGCQWEYLPHDLPPAGAVKYYFYKWRDDGTGQTIHDLLRWQVREKKGRLVDPSLVALDTQSLHAAAGGPPGRPGGTRTTRCRAVSGDWPCRRVGPGDRGGGAGRLRPRQRLRHRPARQGRGGSRHRAEGPGGTRGSRRRSWTTGSRWASTSKSSSATRPRRGSCPSTGGGLWSRRTGS